jgi:hypothetical protein
MSERLGKLESTDYDLWLSQSEKTAIERARKSSEAFTMALARQVKRGREKAVYGTFVDTTPPIGALRIRGTIALSACGSPAAMCAESGYAGGAAALK